MQEPAKQPIRVYASLAAADTEEERAELLLRELDRTKAFERSAIALFSPTGSGYVNYVACETYEYLTRGDCASMAIEYSVLPSALSLTRTAMGTRASDPAGRQRHHRAAAGAAGGQTPGLLSVRRVAGLQGQRGDVQRRERRRTRGAGIEAAVFVGTPAFTHWRKALWGGRPQNVPRRWGPGPRSLPRGIPDWTDLPADERAKVRYLLLQNGDDPIPKFRSPCCGGSPTGWVRTTPARSERPEGRSGSR